MTWMIVGGATVVGSWLFLLVWGVIVSVEARRLRLMVETLQADLRNTAEVKGLAESVHRLMVTMRQDGAAERVRQEIKSVSGRVGTDYPLVPDSRHRPSPGLPGNGHSRRQEWPHIDWDHVEELERMYPGRGKMAFLEAENAHLKKRLSSVELECVRHQLAGYPKTPSGVPGVEWTLPLPSPAPAKTPDRSAVRYEPLIRADAAATARSLQAPGESWVQCPHCATSWTVR